MRRRRTRIAHLFDVGLGRVQEPGARACAFTLPWLLTGGSAPRQSTGALVSALAHNGAGSDSLFLKSPASPSTNARAIDSARSKPVGGGGGRTPPSWRDASSGVRSARWLIPICGRVQQQDGVREGLLAAGRGVAGIQVEWWRLDRRCVGEAHVGGE